MIGARYEWTRSMELGVVNAFEVTPRLKLPERNLLFGVEASYSALGSDVSVGSTTSGYGHASTDCER